MSVISGRVAGNVSAQLSESCQIQFGKGFSINAVFAVHWHQHRTPVPHFFGGRWVLASCGHGYISCSRMSVQYGKSGISTSSSATVVRLAAAPPTGGGTASSLLNSRHVSTGNNGYVSSPTRLVREHSSIRGESATRIPQKRVRTNLLCNRLELVMSVKLGTAKQERRKAPRAKLSRCVRVRPFDFRLSEEVCMTANVSRSGLYIETTVGHYYAGMNVSVTRNFQPDGRDQIGRPRN